MVTYLFTLPEFLVINKQQGPSYRMQLLTWINLYLHNFMNSILPFINYLSREIIRMISILLEFSSNELGMESISFMAILFL